MPTLCPTYHVPVLLSETVDGLNVRPDGTYVDATFGGGGHSREILRRLGAKGRLYGFDQDADARNNVPEDERFTFVAANFRFLPNWMRYYGEIEGVDGVLADLGVSSHHFDDETRGFSFRFDAPLDMRMNTRGGNTAADVLNTYEEEQLARIFQLFGELKNARRLASAIVKARGTKPLAQIADLLACVHPLVPKEREKKDLAKVFQALRIEVNHEMDVLRALLEGALRVLKPGGRLSILTYHSLEDRMVKNFMRAGNIEGKVEQDFYGNRLAPMKQQSDRALGRGTSSKPQKPKRETACGRKMRNSARTSAT